MALLRLSSWLLCLPLFMTTSRATQNDQQPLLDKQLPNMVFILTDDQDLHMDSLSYMPHLNRLISDQGTSFHRHYCTVALCCPSRVSLWTGKAAHNTNVTDINPPYGGYPKFVSQGFNSDYLPLWLQEAGYNTYYTGKLFNAQRVSNYDSPHAAGWTGSDFLLDPYTYEYLNATFQRNHDPPVSYESQYSTDVLAEKSYGFLEDALGSDRPFFLTIAPIAPHSNVHIFDKQIDGNYTEKSAKQSPPVPAERHKHLFEDVVVPRTLHFNPDESSGASWIKRLPQQNQTNVDFNDDFYRNRLRALQAVDEIVEGVVSRLEQAGVLDQTYIFFSTDNGYHIGQHRLQPGKQCAYEEDINIPFLVRGPGVPKNRTTVVVSTHTDLAPTFLSIAGATEREGLDGIVMPLTTVELDEAEKDFTRQEHINVEMWGIIMSEGKYGSILYPNHTYKALRITAGDYDLLYTVWCSGERELYDLKRDPHEMNNLFTLDLLDDFMSSSATFETSPTITMTNNVTNTFGSHSLAAVLSRLDALLMVLKTCKGRQCIDPWSVLHPNGDVHNLADALDPIYDDFFAEHWRDERVEFLQCEKGYIAESEWPRDQGKAFTGVMEHEVHVEG